MKLYVLTENTASGKFLAEHGLSYYIEHDKNILFDTGHSDVYIKNAERLGLNLSTIEDVVLSHGHWDHGNGLEFLADKKLVCHPDAFQERYGKGKQENIGLNLSIIELSKKFEIITTLKPYKVSRNVIYLGEIPRLTAFESQTTTFCLYNGEDDFVLDDSGLAINLNNEIIVISGCAHSGICNMIEHAKTVTGISKIRAVIGGFHLKHNDYQTQETIKYLKTQDIKELYPSHCTGFPALNAFYNEFEINQLKTGMVLEF